MIVENTDSGTRRRQGKKKPVRQIMSDWLKIDLAYSCVGCCGCTSTEPQSKDSKFSVLGNHGKQGFLIGVHFDPPCNHLRALPSDGIDGSNAVSNFGTVGRDPECGGV